MTSKPREGERRAVAATALDELPDRLAGQRPEGFGAEFPGKDEQQQAARRPDEDEETRPGQCAARAKRSDTGRSHRITHLAAVREVRADLQATRHGLLPEATGQTAAARAARGSRQEMTRSVSLTE